MRKREVISRISRFERQDVLGIQRFEGRNGYTLIKSKKRNIRTQPNELRFNTDDYIRYREIRRIDYYDELKE